MIPYMFSPAGTPKTFVSFRNLRLYTHARIPCSRCVIKLYSYALGWFFSPMGLCGFNGRSRTSEWIDFALFVVTKYDAGVSDCTDSSDNGAVLSGRQSWWRHDACGYVSFHRIRMRSRVYKMRYMHTLHDMWLLFIYRAEWMEFFLNVKRKYNENAFIECLGLHLRAWLRFKGESQGDEIQKYK